MTQAEVDAGSFVNTATVTGVDPSNATVAKSASATVTADATATLGLTKTASPNTNVTLVTTITGNGPITNIPSTDVEGKTVSAKASYTPSGGFAFTGTEAQRLGFLGLLAVLGGWFLMAAARRRREDEAVTGEG